MPVKYETKHGGCAILCGSAPCLYEDLAKAKELRPDAVILGVNFVGYLVPEVEHIWTQHTELAHKIKEKTGRPIKVHARPKEFRNGGGLWFLPAPDVSWEQVDYVWPDLTWVNGSSGGAGALWAKHGMGFDEVIMAGVLLQKGQNFYNEKYADTQFRGNGINFAGDHNIEHWQACMIKHSDQGKMQGIYAMSGFPRGLLGAPPGLED